MDYETREHLHASMRQEPAAEQERPQKKATAKPWRFGGKWLPSARWTKLTRVDGKFVKTKYTQEEARAGGGFFINLDAPPMPWGRYKRREDALRAWKSVISKGYPHKDAKYSLVNTDTKERVDLG